MELFPENFRAWAEVTRTNLWAHVTGRGLVIKMNTDIMGQDSCSLGLVIRIEPVADKASCTTFAAANHSECLSILQITPSWRSSHTIPDTNETSSPPPEKGGF